MGGKRRRVETGGRGASGSDRRPAASGQRFFEIAPAIDAAKGGALGDPGAFEPGLQHHHRPADEQHEGVAWPLPSLSGRAGSTGRAAFRRREGSARTGFQEGGKSALTCFLALAAARADAGAHRQFHRALQARYLLDRKRRY